jgi:futalosine hydrolase
MNCLLVAATTKEITPFLSHYQNNGDQDIDILITGIGLTVTTYALTKQIAMKKPDLIIQAGIAGSFTKKLSPGSVVVIKEEIFADLGVVEDKQLKTMFDLGLMKPGQTPFNKEGLVNPHGQLIKQTGLKAVKSVSVNHITTSKQMTAFYQNKFNPAIESMEGAALHYVCLMEKIPFLQIRSISNYVGERNKSKWDIKNAVINLNKEIINFITTLEPLNP